MPAFDMAVNTHRVIHSEGPQKLEVAGHASWEGGGGDVAAGKKVQLQQQGYQHQQPACVGLAAAPASGKMVMVGQVCPEESNVTFGSAQGQEMAPCIRKRKRDAELGAQSVAAHLQQQLVDVDRLVLQYMARMRVELTERRLRHARQVIAAVEAAVAKRLRDKDEEIERLSRLSWAHEERFKRLVVEMQMWRDLAQSNQAAANALQGELRQVLDALARRRIAAAAADDAESCCQGENDVVGAGEEEELGMMVAARGTWS